ncbi:hypothetical protein [Lysobacter enzymogenes]|uniref:Uncharacterized protein n=1 Tax=Lysobacter enzymogenes TaxID=69 RepID=A0A3N2RE41_LYSEN|nr:hypothetical protein [Lysobacter enzymogenes]ROU05705.1 hypothetical protein D9T17_17445 [Lysobacter enzymogenes]
MFYIGLSAEPRPDAVAAAFAAHAPQARLRWGEFDDDCAGVVFVELHRNASEFPFALHATNLAGGDDYALGLAIARTLSLALDCRSVCDGTRHGPGAYPGWCIVWIEGQAWLGDDYYSLFYDDSPELSADERAQLGPIKLLHRLEL